MPNIAAFPTTKKDKRHIKHSTLISRVKKSSSSSSEAQKNKRRRQKKRLAVNLESLADTLPDVVDTATIIDEAGRKGRDAALREQANVDIIHHKSMKSRPGALKRREKIDKGERERFARNLAEMSGKKTGETGENGAKQENSQQGHDRWVALRGFIAQTMEQRPELKR